MRSKVSTFDRVLKLLRAEEKYRNSDRKLYLRILDDLGCIVWSEKTKAFFIPVDKFMIATPFETVRRSRQEVQRNFPELGATDPKVRKLRRQKEATKGTFIYREAYNPAHDGIRV